MSDPFWHAPAPLLAELCGWEWGHDLNLIDERDGSRTYECRICGAEIVETGHE